MRFTPSCLALCAALLAAQGMAHEAPTARGKAPRKTAFPARQSGLWEVTVRSDDLVLKRAGQAPHRPQTVRMCTSAEAEPVMLLALLPSQEDCHAVKVTRRPPKAGAGYAIATVCYVHDNRVDARIELQGDLRSAYRGTFDVTYAQTPLGNTGRMAFEGRRLGACPAGQRPGDMVLPNGVTVNVVDDRKRAQGRAHGHAH